MNEAQIFPAFFYGIYTVLCAVLRERWGKPHAGRMCVAPLAWIVQRSNIAHNVSSAYAVKKATRIEL